MEVKAPWIDNYGDIPFHLEYPKGTMWDSFYNSATAEPQLTALLYMGRRYSYKTVVEKCLVTAKAFDALGVGVGTRVAICLPNIPQAVYCLYALNKLGAVACMVHPLSAVRELTELLSEAECEYAVILDSFAYKFDDAIKNMPHLKLIVTSGADELGFIKSSAYRLTSGKKYKKSIPAVCLPWKSFLKGADGVTDKNAAANDCKKAAVVLFSGGTSGIPKGIALSNNNLNALAVQTNAIGRGMLCHCRMLAVLPVFHGFGLGICVHAPLVYRGTSVLIPRIKTEGLGEFLEKNKISFFVGVPTLFEALIRQSGDRRLELSCIKGVFSGGDCMSVSLKREVNGFLERNGATARVQEGYGATECVAASCLTPYFSTKEEGIGFPYPDTYFKICAPDTCTELPYGTDGEICLRGPTVMLGYLNHTEENAQALRRHDDGFVWLHTGDMGCMDSDGYVYFRQRIKRMIVSSGYNIYPSRIENVINSHPQVKESCAVGVDDPYRIKKIKAFVVLKDGAEPNSRTKDEIMELCRLNIAKYALPYDIEFIEAIPKTKLNKTDYRAVEEKAR